MQTQSNPMVQPFQRRRKLALRVYNYSVLDRLDRPQEYRINHQLRARSAEALYVSNPADWEPDPTPKPIAYPYPSLVSQVGESYHVRVATPWGELLSDWEPDAQERHAPGLVVEMRLGGALTSWFVAQSHGELNHDTIQGPRERVYAAWAGCLTDVLEQGRYPYLRYYAPNKKRTEHFELLLKRVAREDYLTIKQKSLGGPQQFANAHLFYFVHRDRAIELFNALQQGKSYE